MLHAVLLVTIPAFMAGGVATYFATRRREPEFARHQWIKLAVYFLIVHLVIFCTALNRRALLALFTGILLLGANEMVRVTSRSTVFLPLAAYTAIAAALTWFIFAAPPAAIIYVYVVIAAFDGFSQLAGQNFGSHKLAPQISPGKTVEGAIGGLVVAAAIGVHLRALLTLDSLQAAAVSGALCGAALAGDLLASWIKRKNGVKNFGRSIPGHGGILDRFDSFFFAATGYWIVSLLLST